MAYKLNMAAGQRAERKMLITIAAWKENEEQKAAILGTRTEDSSVEYNGDVNTSTDIRGINYTDLGKTQPQQSFDPAYIIGGDALTEYMARAALENNINAYNGVFDIYLVAAFLKDGEKFHTTKHTGCSIIPQSLGGSDFVSLPYDVYFSNNIVKGSVKSIAAADLLAIAEKFEPEAAAEPANTENN
jgi:hypothetical protein